jgi:transforming growth factor-beta-induced protein
MISFLKRAAVATFIFAGSTNFVAAQDIVDTAVKAGSFNTLVAAVKAAGLVDTLKSKGPFTVFAPTDAAFKKLPPATLASLLKPENKKTLTSILTYHVVAGDYPAARILKPKASSYPLKSVEGSSITVNKSKGVKVSGATVTKTDITTSNGTIHVIDTVLLPPKVKAALAAGSKKHAAAAPAKKH